MSPPLKNFTQSGWKTPKFYFLKFLKHKKVFKNPPKLTILVLLSTSASFGSWSSSTFSNVLKKNGKTSSVGLKKSNYIIRLFSGLDFTLPMTKTRALSDKEMANRPLKHPNESVFSKSARGMIYFWAFSIKGIYTDYQNQVPILFIDLDPGGGPGL